MAVCRAMMPSTPSHSAAHPVEVVAFESGPYEGWLASDDGEGSTGLRGALPDLPRNLLCASCPPSVR